GEASGGARAAADQTGGLDGGARDQPAGGGRDEPRSGARGERGALPRRPVLSARGGAAARTAFAPATRRPADSGGGVVARALGQRRQRERSSAPRPGRAPLLPAPAPTLCSAAEAPGVTRSSDAFCCRGPGVGPARRRGPGADLANPEAAKTAAGGKAADR